MCGIAGAVGFIDEAVQAALARMHFAQRHRGPDDEGFWSSQARPVGHGAQFLFRRLAIIDISMAGHQPMTDRATGNVVIFNGEIYNYKELRNELEEVNVSFDTQSDTEVLLKAYGFWGADFLKRLRGMFALAVWDNSAEQVLVARDRLGIKPFYYSAIDRPGNRRTILFASELRSILAGGLTGRQLNPRAVSSYLWNGFVAGEETIVKDISQLLPGNAATLRPDGTMNQYRYWRYPSYRVAPNGSEELEHELRTSIRQHLVSDVPLGIFLSGGIDSSAIAALAAQEAPAENVVTYNLSFDETKHDEPEIARAVADALGTNHKELRLTQDLFKSQLNEALSCIDQPTFDALNTYFVSRAVREAGLTVALAGTGGDELFGGYRSFSELPKAQLVSSALSLLPDSALRSIGSVVSRYMNGSKGLIDPQTRWGKVGDVLCTRGSLIGLYQTSYSLFTQSFRDELFERTSDQLPYGLPEGMRKFLGELVENEDTLHAISTIELVCFIGERLLRDTDTASMAVSLEVRVPLLDHSVVESCAHVHTRKRFYPLGKKRLLQELALSGLDQRLFNRPKTGFGLPIEFWSRQSLQGDLEAIFNDTELCQQVGLEASTVSRLWEAFKARSPGIYWSRIWSIFVLLWWCRTYDVGR